MQHITKNVGVFFGVLCISTASWNAKNYSSSSRKCLLASPKVVTPALYKNTQQKAEGKVEERTVHLLEHPPKKTCRTTGTSVR
jgi:hypothetical protein